MFCQKSKRFVKNCGYGTSLEERVTFMRLGGFLKQRVIATISFLGSSVLFFGSRQLIQFIADIRETSSMQVELLREILEAIKKTE